MDATNGQAQGELFTSNLPAPVPESKVKVKVFQPYPHQQECWNAIMTAHGNGVKTMLCVMPTGSGKAAALAYLPRLGFERMLVLVHRDVLVQQLKATIEWVNPGIDCQIEQASDRAGRHAQVVVASVPTLGRMTKCRYCEGAGCDVCDGEGKILDRITKWRPDEFDALIVDECFIAGTLVGGKPIEDIRAGDFVRTRKGFRRVTRTFKSKPRTLLTVALENGEVLTCTHDHPFFVDGGWVPAKRLTRGDVLTEECDDGDYTKAMRGLRHGVYASKLEQFDGSDLLATVQVGTSRGEAQEDYSAVHGMRHRSNGRRCAGVAIGAGRASLLQRDVQAYLPIANVVDSHVTDEQEICERQNAEQESYDIVHYAGQDVGNATANWMEAPGSRRQRIGVDGTRADDGETSQLDAADCEDTQNSRGWVSTSLQGGHWRSSYEDCDRDRWSKPLFSSGAGREEGRMSTGLRVDSVQIHERTSDGTFGGMCGDGFVYNLEVEDESEYFANGVLVHNCHHVTSTSYINILKYFRCGQLDGPLLIGWTATKKRGDNLPLSNVFQELVYERDILWGIESGFLCRLRSKVIRTTTDISRVGSVAGDFDNGKLATHVNTDYRNSVIISAMEEHAADRECIVAFATDIAHAELLTTQLIERGHAAVCVTERTKREDRQELLRQFKDGEARVFVNVGVACLDSETEILTADGWIGYRDIRRTHRVANWKDGKIWFQEPLGIEVRERKRDERMVVLSTRHRSIRVTADHRMLFRQRSERTFREARAFELVDREGFLPTGGLAEPFAVAPPIESPPRGRRISANAYILRQKGMSHAEARKEAERRAADRDALRRRAPSELSERECEFIGFWLCDGGVAKLASGGREYRLYQGEKYAGICKWIDDLLSDLELDVVRRTLVHRSSYALSGSTTIIQWSLSRGTGFGPQRRNGVYGLEPYLDKAGSHLLWGLNTEQFAAFMRGMWMADGNHGMADEPIRDGWRIGTTNKRLLDLVQAIATTRGYRATLKPCKGNAKRGYKMLWRITVRQRVVHEMTKYRLQFEGDPWQSETVWCVKSHSSYIVTRRDGTVTVTGNTEGYDNPRVDCLLMARPTKSTLLYTQMIGRATRILPGKTDALILDFVDVCGKNVVQTASMMFGMPNMDLLGEDVLEAKKKVDRAASLGVNVENVDSLDKLEGEANVMTGVARGTIRVQTMAQAIDLFASCEVAEEVRKESIFDWIRMSDDRYMLPVGKDHGDFTAYQNALGEWMVQHRTSMGAIRGENLGTSARLPFGKADAFVKRNAGSFTRKDGRAMPMWKLIASDAPWKAQHLASDAQRDLLRKMGVDVFPDRMTKGAASMLISKLKLTRMILKAAAVVMGARR